MNTEYEVINKSTGEISPVESMTFGEEYVDVTTREASGNVIGLRFTNKGKEGNLIDEDTSNDAYVIRQVGTHLSANQDEVIDNAGNSTQVTDEQASQIMNDVNTGDAGNMGTGQLGTSGNAGFQG